MDWGDFLFLGLGVGIGVAGKWLLRPHSTVEFAPLETGYVKQDALTEQLHRTQMAYQMAVENSQFKAGFLARTSHELRSPLNGLIGLHQLILADLCDDPAEEREFIAQAHASALKLLNLLDQLVNVSKVEQGNEELDIQPLQLAAVLAEVEQLTQIQAQNRNLRLTIEPPAPELYILADPRWLRQVLVNLIMTSIALMDEGFIRLTAEVGTASPQVHLKLEDQRPASAWQEPVDLLKSVAMPTAHPPEAVSQRSVGDRQPDPDLDKLPSSGLSLLINQTLVELMQGSLEVLAVPSSDSDLTCIQCSLPLAVE